MMRDTILTLVLGALLIGGCAAPGAKIIRIEPPQQAGLTTKNTLSVMLLEMGYRHLGLKDPVTGNYIETIELYGEYRMAFAAADNEAIQVSVSVKEDSGQAVLQFSEADMSQLSERAERLFRTLVDRLTLEFGQEYVTVRTNS